MKHVLVLCLFSVFFVSLANCDCTTQCKTAFQSSLSGISSKAQVCGIMRTYLSCLQSSCRVDLSPYLALVQEMLKSYGLTCDFISGSNTGSNPPTNTGSCRLFTALGALLLVAYKIFL